MRRTVIVTGGNTGLGFEAARSLAAAGGWNVVLACRSLEKGQEAARQLAASTGNPGVAAAALDLSSLESVRQFARDFQAPAAAPLGALVCNAGTQIVSGLQWSADGFEATFAVNHLAHFLLVNLLLPKLAEHSRVVFVSSGTHDPAQRTGLPPPQLDDLNQLAQPDPQAFADPGFAGRRAYTTSKLCNVLCTYELSRRLVAKGAAVTVNAFDPGMMPGSGLARDYGAFSRFAWRFVLPLLRPFMPNVNSVPKSGRNLARLVTDPALATVTGQYFVGQKAAPSSQLSYDVQQAAALWALSERLVGLPQG